MERSMDVVFHTLHLCISTTVYVFSVGLKIFFSFIELLATCNVYIFFRFFFARYHNVLQRKKTLKDALALGVGPSFTGILKHQYLLLLYSDKSKWALRVPME